MTRSSRSSCIDDMDTKTARSVFAIFVEQMQNMIRYSAENGEHAARSAATTPSRHPSSATGS